MSRNAVDPVTTIAQVLAEALRAAAPSNAATPEWRTLAEEARVRGFPSARAFRDWCYRVGVEVKEPGGVSAVSPAEVDRAFAGAAPRPVPPSSQPERSEAAERERVHEELRARRRRG